MLLLLCHYRYEVQLFVVRAGSARDSYLSYSCTGKREMNNPLPVIVLYKIIDEINIDEIHEILCFIQKNYK